MLTLTTETALDILIDWLRDNINCDTPIIFDNDEDNTDSAALLPGLSRHVKMSVTSVILNSCNM